MSQVKKLEERISDLHKTIIDLKSIPNSKSSEEDINLLQYKFFKLQDGNKTLNGEAENLIELETISVPSSEANDSYQVELEGLLNRMTSEAE